MLPTVSRAGIMLLGHSYISSLNISSLVYWQYQSLTCQSWFRCLSFLTEMAVGGHWVGLSLATVRRLFYTVCACKDGWSYTWAMSAQLVLSNTLSCIIKDFDRRAGIYASFFLLLPRCRRLQLEIHYLRFYPGFVCVSFGSLWQVTWAWIGMHQKCCRLHLISQLQLQCTKAPQRTIFLRGQTFP